MGLSDRSKMNFDETTSTSGRESCQAMLDAATPLIYIHNAFRITGLMVDASRRDVKKRIDDLKYAEELGDADDEHSHAYAFDPPPSLEKIREAANRLQNPEQRIIEEFFWFWPNQWGEGKKDKALIALKNGDIDGAYQLWFNSLSADVKRSSLIAKHNLAVMYQLVALDSEHLALEGEIEPDQQQALSKYWKTCFKWWEELTDDEDFWSLVTERIRILDDRGLTTGFGRRMRASLPEAMDKINAEQAIAFFEKGKLDLGERHLTYMLETHQGMDDVPKTLAMVTKPLKTRVESLVERARALSKQDPQNAGQAASDLLNAVEDPANILRLVLPETDYVRIDLFDSIADTCLECIDAYFRGANKDWGLILDIITGAVRFGSSNETKSRLALKRVIIYCEEVYEAVEKDPHSGERLARDLIDISSELLSNTNQPYVSQENRKEARDRIANTIMSCAVTYGNETRDWGSCVDLLEKSLGIVVDDELRTRIEKNLHIVKQNHTVYGNLEPITKAPRLDASNGVGYTLYGCSDKDPETGSYLSTYYFVLLGIPLFPISRYRVIPTLFGYRFLGKAPLRTFDKWHLAVSITSVCFVFLFLFGVFNGSDAPSSSNKRASNSTPTRTATSYPSRPTSRPTIPPVSYPRTNSWRETLSSEIASGKARANDLETQLQQLDNQIQVMEAQMDTYERSNRIDDYNALVPEINILITRRKSLYTLYSLTIDEINKKVDLYNLR
jgi:hypothetical protein